MGCGFSKARKAKKMGGKVNLKRADPDFMSALNFFKEGY